MVGNMGKRDSGYRPRWALPFNNLSQVKSRGVATLPLQSAPSLPPLCPVRSLPVMTLDAKFPDLGAHGKQILMKLPEAPH